jgi:hypothetical protein
MPQKANELHKLLRLELGPALTRLGFERMAKTAVAAWVRPEGKRWLLLWFQPSQWNTENSPGFTFTVEMRLASVPSLRAWGYHRRLTALMSPGERDELLRLENGVVSKLPAPDPDFVRMFPDQDRAKYLARFAPRTEPYQPGEDVWFRHWDEADLKQLMAFIGRVLPEAIDNFLSSAAAADEPSSARQ